jgi:hypothetical protein
MENFPWTYDQYQRYAVLEEVLKVLNGKKKTSVLDVGGCSPDRKGRSLWLPLQRILKENSYVVDLLFCSERGFIQADGHFLPFKAGSFDVVSALDVIEHIPFKMRETFIQELSRVSRSSIVISAPFKDERLEQVEQILFDQVKELYGAEHQQLLEHKKCGLPEIEATRQHLGRHFLSQTDFAYGSLMNWLFFQSQKNQFLFSNKSEAIQILIDRWMISSDQRGEFIPPFSRHFWIGDKNLSQKELESGTALVKSNLVNRTGEKPNIEELGKWVDDMTLSRTAHKVSALVFSFGNDSIIEECLNHLLTQKGDIEQEVAVMDLSPGQSIGRFVRERFPMVQVFYPEKDELLSSLVSRLTAQLKGKNFLWISDGILLPADSVGKLIQCQKQASSPFILIPVLLREGEDFIFWGRGKHSSNDRRKLHRFFEGKIQKKSHDFHAETAGWVYSECLFFPREALLERDFSNQSLNQESVFLWPSIKTEGSFLRCPEVLAHKKESRSIAAE